MQSANPDSEELIRFN